MSLYSSNLTDRAHELAIELNMTKKLLIGAQSDVRRYRRELQESETQRLNALHDLQQKKRRSGGGGGGGEDCSSPDDAVRRHQSTRERELESCISSHEIREKALQREASFTLQRLQLLMESGAALTQRLQQRETHITLLEDQHRRLKLLSLSSLPSQTSIERTEQSERAELETLERAAHSMLNMLRANSAEFVAYRCSRGPHTAGPVMSWRDLEAFAADVSKAVAGVVRHNEGYEVQNCVSTAVERARVLHYPRRDLGICTPQQENSTNQSLCASTPVSPSAVTPPLSARTELVETELHHRQLLETEALQDVAVVVTRAACDAHRLVNKRRIDPPPPAAVARSHAAETSRLLRERTAARMDAAKLKARCDFLQEVCSAQNRRLLSLRRLRERHESTIMNQYDRNALSQVTVSTVTSQTEAVKTRTVNSVASAAVFAAGTCVGLAAAVASSTA